MRRRLGVKPPLQRIGEARAECGGKFVGGKLGKRRLAVEDRREPCGVGAEAYVRKIRPFMLGYLAFGGAQEHDAVAPLPQPLGPGQARDPKPGDTLSENAG